MVNTDFWKGKKVFLTGHTGFKGSWLTIWLLEMGAEVIGYSNDIPTNPSIFVEANLESEVHIEADINDADTLVESVK